MNYYHYYNKQNTKLWITIEQNPDSFSVVYGTDLANDYVNDLIDLFKELIIWQIYP